MEVFWFNDLMIKDMAFYVKVTKEVADALGLTSIRNKTADGAVLLWQADLNSIEGDTIFDRAQKVGGVAISPQQARCETDGVEVPVEVFTPDEYKTPEDTPTVIPETYQEGGYDE